MLESAEPTQQGGRTLLFATSPTLDKSAVLVTLAHDRAALVQRSVHDGASLERAVLGQVLDLGHAAVALFLHAQGDGDLGPSVPTPDGRTRYRSATPQPRPLRTLFGEHSCTAYVYASGCQRPIELRPIDARLNLPAGPASDLVQEFSQLFCVDKAFAVGARQFHTVFRQQLSVDVLEDSNRDMGEQADRFLEQIAPPPPAEEGTLLVATADAKGVPWVQAKAQQVPGLETKERPGNRRRATLGCVYTVDRYVRTPEQLVAALLRDATVAQPPERPVACHKHDRAYFAPPGQSGDDALPSAYRTWTWLAEPVTARAQPGPVVVRLMDGPWRLGEASDTCREDFVAQREAVDPLLLVDILVSEDRLESELGDTKCYEVSGCSA